MRVSTNPDARLLAEAIVEALGILVEGARAQILDLVDLVVTILPWVVAVLVGWWVLVVIPERIERWWKGDDS